MSKLGVVIVGVGGAVASTVIAGVELMLRGLVPRMGMITEGGGDIPSNPLTGLLDLAKLEDLVFGGWDINSKSLFEAAMQHKVLPSEQLEAARDALGAIVPWPAIFKSEYSTNLKGEKAFELGYRRYEWKSDVQEGCQESRQADQGI